MAGMVLEAPRYSWVGNGLLERTSFFGCRSNIRPIWEARLLEYVFHMGWALLFKELCHLKLVDGMHSL